jgi:hypothetical protein
MRDMKRLLQAIYDDYMFVPNSEVIEQIIGGKKYRFILPQDRQDQRQWQEAYSEVESNE